jgi:hypothetical protein
MKKVVLASSLVFAMLFVQAQTVSDSPAKTLPESEPIFDTLPALEDKKFVVGFQMGRNYSQFYNTSKPGSDQLFTDGQGFRLGLQFNWNVNDYLSVVPRMELVLNNTKVNVTDADNITYQTPIMPVNMQLMAHAQIGLPCGKWKPYLLLGPNLRMPINSEDIPAQNYGSKTDFAADFGLGVEYRFKDVIIAPEIRYTYGFTDINKNPFLHAIYHHQMCFMLTFKG